MFLVLLGGAQLMQQHIDTIRAARMLQLESDHVNILRTKEGLDMQHHRFLPREYVKIVRYEMQQTP